MKHCFYRYDAEETLKANPNYQRYVRELPGCTGCYVIIGGKDKRLPFGPRQDQPKLFMDICVFSTRSPIRYKLLKPFRSVDRKGRKYGGYRVRVYMDNGERKSIDLDDAVEMCFGCSYKEQMARIESWKTLGEFY